jgi:hypothetical protein
VVFKTTSLVVFITGVASTLSLSYLRVCAVWRWNRFIVAFFGISWLSVVASCFTLIISLKEIMVEDYCNLLIVGPTIPSLFITTFVNHTAIFLAITYGVCKNTIDGDLAFRENIRLMLGKRLPTFSKALLHDSQISYMWVLTRLEVIY